MRRITTAVALCILSVLSLAAFGSPAQAAWYCGDRCNRTDPDSYYVTPYQTCAMDAKTVDSVYNSTHTVTLQLRYSPYCRTIWGRIYGGRNQKYYVSLQLVYDRDNPEDNTTLNATREIGPPETRTYSWSYQWNDADVTIRTCVSTGWSTDPRWRIMCTQPY